MQPDYVIGLDLGQTTDFTAVAVLERPPADNDDPVYALRHLQRFALGTPYTEIVPAVVRLADTGRLRGSPLVVDQTGVGRPVVDLLRRTPGAGRVVPVTITAGEKATQTADGSWHVPKKDLVSRLQLLLQAGRLKIAKALPEADVLVRELEAFQVRITAAAHETFGARREGAHDDLVLAAALACWWAARFPRLGPDSVGSGGAVVAATLPPEVWS